MNVTVKFFAFARQLTGVDSAVVELPEGSNLADLRSALWTQYPPLAEFERHLVFAVDTEYAGDETPLRNNAEIACIPPVSGG